MILLAGISPLPGTHYGGGGGGRSTYLPHRMPINATNGGGGIGGPTSVMVLELKSDGLIEGGSGGLEILLDPKVVKVIINIVVVRYRT